MLIGTAPYVVSTQAQKPSIRMALTALNLLPVNTRLRSLARRDRQPPYQMINDHTGAVDRHQTDRWLS